jgi:hypothetical protein
MRRSQQMPEQEPIHERTDQTDSDPRQAQPQPGDEYDPLRPGIIPQPPTGEQRWVRDDLGAPSWAKNEPFEQRTAGGPAGAPAGNEGIVERGAGSAADEDYGQGETQQFDPRGEEPGIEQQEALQSQQYEREKRRSRQGMLGAVGDMLGGLFGNTKRTADTRDEGEAAGEAHP